MSNDRVKSWPRLRAALRVAGWAIAYLVVYALSGYLQPVDQKVLSLFFFGALVMYLLNRSVERMEDRLKEQEGKIARLESRLQYLYDADNNG